MVLATGAHETPLLFENNDLPGIMLASSARRLMATYGVRPGRQAVVATETEEGYETALELLDAGVRVAAIVDTAEERSGSVAVAVRERGITVLPGHRVVKANGRGKVKGAVVAPVANPSPSRRIRCDLLCMSGSLQPVDALLHQMGSSQDGVTLAGQVNGAAGLPEILGQGRDAGRRAAGAPDEEANDIKPPGLVPGEAPALPTGKGGRTYVCFCEDVSAHDIEQAIDEGFADVQTLKRYTTVTMGPCQGKMCGRALANFCDSRNGSERSATGGDTYTTFRPALPTGHVGCAGRARKDAVQANAPGPCTPRTRS